MEVEDRESSRVSAIWRTNGSERVATGVRETFILVVVLGFVNFDRYGDVDIFTDWVGFT